MRATGDCLDDRMCSLLYNDFALVMRKWIFSFYESILHVLRKFATLEL